MSGKSFAIDQRINDYVDRLSQEEPEVLRRLREETAAMENAQMQISPLQGRFMAMLARLLNVTNYLEVGVFTGYSSLAMALAMPGDARVVACDVSEEYTAVARRYWREAGVEGKIDLRIAPATETLQGLIDGGQGDQFDFAFIDADKANMPTYFELCLELVRPNGLILVDNVLWSGRVLEQAEDEDTRTIQQFNERLPRDERVESMILPIADGLTLARKRVSV